jgi:hypothetical protein
MASDYERIKCLCVKRGDLFEDSEFPPVQNSVFYHQTPPFQFVWKRPKVFFYIPCTLHINNLCMEPEQICN